MNSYITRLWLDQPARHAHTSCSKTDPLHNIRKSPGYIETCIPGIFIFCCASPFLPCVYGRQKAGCGIRAALSRFARQTHTPLLLGAASYSSAYFFAKLWKDAAKSSLPYLTVLRYWWVSKLLWATSMIATAILEQWSEIRS